MPDLVTSSAPYLKPVDGPGDAWSQENAASGHAGTQTLLAVETVVPPPEVAAALGLAQGEAAVVRRRLMYLDAQPVDLVDSWYPASLAAGTVLAEHRKIPGGAVRALADLGYVRHRAVETVGAHAAQGREGSLLNASPWTALLDLFRVSYTADGFAFEVEMMTMRPDSDAGQRKLRYEITVG